LLVLGLGAPKLRFLAGYAQPQRAPASEALHRRRLERSRPAKASRALT
jgi:hypothetical protein